MTNEKTYLLSSLWRYCQKIGVAAYKEWESENKQLLIDTFGFVPDVVHQVY